MPDMPAMPSTPDMPANAESPAASTGYDPNNPAPYTPPPAISTPEITAPPPSPAASPSTNNRSPVFGGGKMGAAGSIAYIGDAILRGYMQGREHKQQMQAVKAKKLMDGFKFAKSNIENQIRDTVQQPGIVDAWNTRSQIQQKYRNSSGLIQRGQGPGAAMSPEDQKALADANSKLDGLDKLMNTSNSLFQGIYQLTENYIGAGGQEGKGKKGKKSDQPQDPAQMAMSSDPQEKIRGILGTMGKIGDPAKFIVSDAVSQYQQHQQQQQSPKARLDSLIAQHDDAIRRGDTSTATQLKSHIDSLKEDLSPERVSHPVYSRDLTPGKSLMGLKNPDGTPLMDALGNPPVEGTDYRKETVGDKTSWIPAAPKPASTKPPNRDDRYIAILQQQSEGKPITDDQKAYLAAYDLYVKRTKTDPGVARAIAFGDNRFVQVLDPANPEAVTFMRAKEAGQSGAHTPQSISFQIDKAIGKAFTSGKPAENISYFNTAVSHLELLKEVSEALQNGDMQLFNRIGNAYATATGGPAPTDFNAVRNAVAGELAKTFSGGRATESEIKLMNETINSAQSPEQLAHVVGYYTRLMGGKLEALKSQYESGKQGKPAFKGSSDGSASGAPKVPPKKGETKTFKGHEYTFDGTQWARP